MNKKRLKLPGLWIETDEILTERIVTNLDQFTKKSWKQFIDEEISSKNEFELKKIMRTKTKIVAGDILEEEYCVKEYLKNMTVERARTKYQEWYYMLKYCKINFFNDKIFQKDGYKCSFLSSHQ